MPVATDPNDYSKWDLLEDSDDEKLCGRSVEEVAKANHGASLNLLKDWLAEASPALEKAVAMQVLDFVRVQHRGIHDDNTARHQEITAFLDKAEAPGGPGMPPLQPLLDLGRYSHTKLAGEGVSKEEQERGERMLPVVMGALNTLWAAECEGGSRALFAAMLKEPDGPTAKKYKKFGFATDVVAKPPLAAPAAGSLRATAAAEARGDATPGRWGPRGSRSWWSTLGKAVAWQLAIAGVAALGTSLYMRHLSESDAAQVEGGAPPSSIQDEL